MLQQKKAGAPRNNTNRKGKGTKEKKRIQVNMSISDRVQISDGIFADLRQRFEDYFYDQGIVPTEDLIKQVARDWAYESWWLHLKRAEDEQGQVL